MGAKVRYIGYMEDQHITTDTNLLEYIKYCIITKEKKPTVRDLRLIAITNATYKLFMGIIKTNIEHQIRYIKEESEVQAGFNKNKRISDNIV